MDTCMDTSASALYVKIDDELAANPTLRIRRPEVGIAPTLSDAELLTMAVCSMRWYSASPRRPGSSATQYGIWVGTSPTCPSSPATTSGCGSPGRRSTP